MSPSGYQQIAICFTTNPLCNSHTALVGNGHKGDMRWIIFVDSWFRNLATWDVHNMIHINVNIILSSDSLTHDQFSRSSALIESPNTKSRRHDWVA